MEQAKREKKAAKAKQHAEKAKSEGHEAKKRRISVEDADERETAHVSDSGSVSSDASVRKKSRHQDKPVTRSTPQKQKALSLGLEESTTPHRQPRTRRRGGDRAGLGENSDQDEDDELVMLTPAHVKRIPPLKKKENKPPSEDEESEEEDEYLRELKQKAREKARLQRLNIDPDRPRTPGAELSKAVGDTRPPSVPEQSQSRPISASSNLVFGRNTPVSEQEDDPEVKILIQSEIPDTKALIVKRKASQPLKQVKEYWCKKFGLDDALARTIFFTWRGTRLFDSTTMRGIIRKLETDHRAQSTSVYGNDDDYDDDDAGDGDRPVKDPSGGNIMLEAITPAIYEERLKQRERSRAGTPAEGDQDEDDAGTSSRAPADDAGAIVIRLVSQSLEPMQLRVRPHTTVGRIMRGFATKRNVDERKTAWMIFDGVRLEPEATVEDVGLEDEDEVEVSIR